MIYMITSSYDLTVRIWNIDEQQLVRIFYFSSAVIALEINEVGSILVTGDELGLIIIWNV